MISFKTLLIIKHFYTKHEIVKANCMLYNFSIQSHFTWQGQLSTRQVYNFRRLKFIWYKFWLNSTIILLNYSVNLMFEKWSTPADKFWPTDLILFLFIIFKIWRCQWILQEILKRLKLSMSAKIKIKWFVINHNYIMLLILLLFIILSIQYTIIFSQIFITNNHKFY